MPSLNRDVFLVVRTSEPCEEGQGGISCPPSALSSEGTQVEAMAQYLSEIGAIPLLSSEEEAQLARRIQEGDEQAKQQLFEANLRLVVHIAKRYRHSGRDLLDLLQDGNLGLLRAVERFDPQMGFKFSTYASYWIRQAIRRGLENTGRMIRLPSSLSGRAGVIARTAHHLFEGVALRKVSPGAE